MGKTIVSRRRLIKLGDSVAVTLPKEFIEKAGLKLKDVVGITADSFVVVINPREKKEQNENSK
jgi:antitoxin component of MazEF toxin-antitoxin module